MFFPENNGICGSVIVSRETQESLFKRQMESAVDVKKHLDIRMIDDMFDERRQKRYHEYRINREAAHLEVFLGSQGRILYSYVAPDIKSGIQELFLDCKNFRCVRIMNACRSRMVWKIAFDFGSSSIEIFIKSSADAPEKDILKKLSRAGVTICISRRNRNEAIEQMFLLLVKDAQELILPDHHGWNRQEGSFQFAGTTTKTFEEVEMYA